MSGNGGEGNSMVVSHTLGRGGCIVRVASEGDE